MRPVFGDREKLRVLFARFLAATAHLRRPTLGRGDPWPYEPQPFWDWLRGRPRTLILPPIEADDGPNPDASTDP